MNKGLLKALNETIELLVECDLLEKAEWFKNKRNSLERLPTGTAEFQDELRGLTRILAGIGSFADLPMVPKPGSNLNESDAEKRQQELTERLYQEAKAHLK